MSLLAMGMLTVGLNLLADFQILPASAGEDQIPAISFVQEVTGRPGSSDSSTQIQRVVLSADKVWLLDEQRRLIQILRVDQKPAVLWEVSLDLNRYRETTDLSRIQKDRMVQERQFVKRLEAFPVDERRESLKAAHIRREDKGDLNCEFSLDAVEGCRHAIVLDVRRLDFREN